MGCHLRRRTIVVLFSIGTRAEYFYPAIDEAERWDDVVKPVVVRGYGSSCEADETCAAAPGLDACVAGAGEERSLGSPGWRSASRYDARDEVHVQRAGQTRVVVAAPTRDVTRRTGLVPRLHAHAGETLVPLGAAAGLGEHARAAILYPGDAVFIPAYWLREKRALNDSCSLSTYAESASGRAADGVASVALDGLLLERYTPAMRSRLLARFLAALTFEFQLDRVKIHDLGEWILGDRVAWMPSDGDDESDKLFRWACVDETAPWRDEQTKDTELLVRKTANDATAFFRGQPVRPFVRALILLDYMEIVVDRVFGPGALPGYARHCAVGYGRIRQAATQRGTKVLRDDHLPPQTRPRLPPVGKVGDGGDAPRRRPDTSGVI